MYLCLICNTQKPQDQMIRAVGNRGVVFRSVKCKECKRLQKNESQRRWESENKYYENHKEELIVKNNIRKNKYRQENREEYLEKSHQYYLDNKDQILANNKIHRNNNKGAKNALTAKRRATKKNATPKWLSQFDKQYIRHLYIQARALTDLTGEVHEVDHVVCLQSDLVCGLHVPWNLQILTKTENRKKDNKIPEDIACQIH